MLTVSFGVGQTSNITWQGKTWQYPFDDGVTKPLCPSFETYGQSTGYVTFTVPFPEFIRRHRTDNKDGRHLWQGGGFSLDRHYKYQKTGWAVTGVYYGNTVTDAVYWKRAHFSYKTKGIDGLTSQAHTRSEYRQYIVNPHTIFIGGTTTWQAVAALDDYFIKAARVASQTTDGNGNTFTTAAAPDWPT